MMTRAGYLVAGVLAITPVSVAGRTYYTMTSEPGNRASIENPSLCSAKMLDSV
jgi:hypothetical protein